MASGSPPSTRPPPSGRPLGPGLPLGGLNLPGILGQLGQTLGSGETVRSILYWQVLGQVLSPVLEPLVREVQQFVDSKFPDQQLSPADAAEAALKGHMSTEAAAAEAQLSGLDRKRFDTLLAASGEPPGLDFLLEAFRRGFIERAGLGPTATTLEQGIRESRLHDKWISTVERMGLRPLPVADAIDAWVEGQIGADEAKRIAYENGVSEADAVTLFHTRGRPPDPTQLIEMNRRGLIPLEGTGPDTVSVQQGIFEGATKDKWWRLLAGLGDYVPPPRTVTALLREGSIPDEEGVALFRKSGLSQELAAAYLHSAHHLKLQGSKDLAKGVVDQLYFDRIITVTQADELYGTLNYDAQESAWLRSIQDLRRLTAQQAAAINKIKALYVAYHIDRSQVVAALNALHLAPDKVDYDLQVWDVERTANAKFVTPAEIASAFFYEILDQAQASQLLQQQGFSALGAWIMLSVRVHARGGLPERPG